MPTYPAQRFFPEQCRNCPTLIGYIEDGDLLGEKTQAEVGAFLDAEGMPDPNCSGPLELDGVEGQGYACAARLLLDNVTKGD